MISTETILIVLNIIVLMVILSQLPGIIENIYDLFALASSEAMARNLAGLITVTASAPDTISLSYEGESEEITYNVIIKDRIVTVESPFKEIPGKGKIGINHTKDWEFENVRKFNIEKDDTGIDVKAS